MIFNKCGKSLNNYSFRYGASKLENVKSYKYHRLILSPYRNFILATQKLKKFASKALHEVRKEMGGHLRDNVNLKIKLFDTLNISPILLYGKEIWGSDCNGKIDKDPRRASGEQIFKMAAGCK